MTTDDQTKTPAEPPTPKRDDRQDRLAARLRENLRKRKDQARGRVKDETEG